ncbi:MAG: pilin [Patescibacteria group bacterium]
MKILITITIFIYFFLSVFTPSVSALDCTGADKDRVECKFGTISPPPALIPFTAPDPSGTAGISQFLTNLVRLIYVIAAIVFIFMILWGAFDWMTSEGDKEKIARARDKIINAVVGILLFAAAYAIIQILGQFTGFKFFTP